jgi:hypothetical protein
VSGENIRAHIKLFEEARNSGLSIDCDAIPDDIRGWPGRGNPYFFELNGFDLPFDTQGLGAFHDEDKDEVYDPCMGDYPVIEVRGCDAPNFPDEMIFWIYNDAGNIHTNTQGDPIRMEVQVQAFAYTTNDEINDMTFQRYKLINRAVSAIDSTFFAMWVDPDLGCHEDDYIGCDTSRSLMFVYNEDELDGVTGCDCPSFSGAVNTYCDDVPILGVDYFRGPRGPKIFVDTVPLIWEPTPAEAEVIIQILDTTFYNTDSMIVRLEKRVELGMSSFTYYMNGSIGNWPNGMTDPQSGAPIEFYRLMSGSWRDGTPFSYGGSGYNLPPTELIDYAFTEVPNDQAGWSMCTANLDFGDRRTIQASGPFRLDPGEVNELIIGVPWVPSIDYPCPDISSLLSADDIAQALFDNCFKLPDGPDAPDLDFIELDKELIVILTNDSISSNNAFELYSEKGLEIPETVDDSLYRFEGYKVYQMNGPSVSVGDLDDIDKARIIFQVDVKNGVNTLYNWKAIQDPTPGSPLIWIPEEQVSGADDGIRHTFQITDDQFAAEDKSLVNHRRYYYTAIAYAYNNYEQFDPSEVVGQRRTYLEGRRNIKTYSPIPRPIVYKDLNSFYGEGPVITRLAGLGAGENFLDLNPESRETMIDGSFDGTIEYLPGAGPIRVRIYNPLDVKSGNFILSFVDNDGDDEILAPNARWNLYEESNPSDIIYSEISIAKLNEQIINEYGFSVTLGQSDDIGDLADETNGNIGAEFEYANPDSVNWYQGIPDLDDGFYNYVKTEAPDTLLFWDDPTQALSQIGAGLFVPYFLCENLKQQNNQFGFVVTPGWLNQQNAVVRDRAPIQLTNNVDIVFTPDKTKWSRCVVVETSNSFHTDLGLESQPIGECSDNFEVRNVPSVGQEDTKGDGIPHPEGAVFPVMQSM